VEKIVGGFLRNVVGRGGYAPVSQIPKVPGDLDSITFSKGVKLIWI
jgi:hypothetical protein